MSQPNLTSRPEPTRCPICHLLPILMTDARDNWVGGCQTQAEPCSLFARVVLQPNYDFAVNQWNDVVRNHLELIAQIYGNGKVA